MNREMTIFIVVFLASATVFMLIFMAMNDMWNKAMLFDYFNETMDIAQQCYPNRPVCFCQIGILPNDSDIYILDSP